MREIVSKTYAERSTDPDRPGQKGFANPVDTANLIDALDDVKSMEDEDLFTSPRSPSSRGRSL